MLLQLQINSSARYRSIHFGQSFSNSSDHFTQLWTVLSSLSLRAGVFLCNPCSILKFMDPWLYKAIKDEDIPALQEKADESSLSQKTTTLNTALHLAVQYEKMECAKLILGKCPSLLWSQNIQGDTALHIAARQDSYSMTELLLLQEKKGIDESEVMLESGGSVERSRSLVRVLNKANDTALHEVAKISPFSRRVTIGELLLNADPEYEYTANAAGETPLYLAAEDPNPASRSLVPLMLEKWPSAAHDGPDGMTALHAAVRCGDTVIVKILLAKKPMVIAGEADKKGWTALHYAVARTYSTAVVLLLEHDSRLALRQDENGVTPLHVAASLSKWDAIDRLIESCPECEEVVDNKGHNFLHTAVEKGNTEMVQKLFASGHITDVNINKTDSDGNTPLHLAVLHRNFYFIKELIDNANGITNFMAVNNEGLTPYGIISKEGTIRDDDGMLDHDYAHASRWLGLFTEWYTGRLMVYESQSRTKEEMEKMYEKRRKEKVTQKMQKVSDSHLVVATLIATVAFAAGFALPGGYKSDGKDEGMASLLRQTSFQAFVISNTLAMILSSFAVVLHFVLKLIEDECLTSTLLIRAFWSTIAAISAMMIAFVTGTYSVLAHSPGLAISACAIGCTFYLFSGLLFGRHYANIRISPKSKSPYLTKISAG